ncbi:hypothetical protein PG996_011893 [Apiospora saccharicola]|uniref:Uncharacterized protein n=1 Tax=Apiospora saccharicola TaxID=335842 RepID=A0ABR1UGB2_9PEZI
MFYKYKSASADQDDEWLVLGSRKVAAAAPPTAPPQSRKQPNLRANTDVNSAPAAAMPDQNTTRKKMRASSKKQPKRLSRVQIV